MLNQKRQYISKSRVEQAAAAAAVPAAAKPLDPFAHIPIKCPICDHEHSLLRFRSRYYAQEKDPDQRPHHFQWGSKSMECFHPPLYFMWMCPQCHFVADQKNFADPLKKTSVGMERFKKTLTDLYADNEGFRKVVETLSADIDMENLDFYQAYRLHLLAIFYLLQFEDMKKKDALNLGRYHLRLAWLLRDMDERPNIRDEVLPKLQALQAQLQAEWPDISLEEVANIRTAAQYYDIAVGASVGIESALDENQVLQQLSRIYLKLSESGEAQKYLQVAINNGTKAKQELDGKLRAPGASLPDDQRQKIVTESRELTNLINQARALLEVAKENYLLDHTQKAEELLRDVGNVAPEQKRELLLRNKIDRRVVFRLVPEEKQKKGMLGGLFG